MLPASGHVSDDATSPNVSINRDESVPEVEVITGRRPLTLVTLMVLLVTCSSCLNSLMMDQYLYQYYAQIVFGNASMDTSRYASYLNFVGMPLISFLVYLCYLITFI